MPTAFLGAAGDRVAVGQQHRVVLLAGAQAGGEATHHIGAIEVVGDLAKPLGLALGAEHAAGFVQTLQCRVGFRVNAHAAVEGETGGHRLQRQVIIGQLIVAGLQHPIVHGQRQHQAMVIEQLEGQISLVDQVFGRLIVF